MLVITDTEFKRLANYIKEHYGIYLREEKRSLVTGRLHNILVQNKFNSFSEYYDYILADKTGKAASALISRMTTNHTYFMRESDHFSYYKECVLPYLAGNVKDKDLRIWSAGCSSGEEPYTLAMLMDEYFGDEKVWWDTKVLATDISGKVLDEAKQGIYEREEISPLPHQWRLKYFRSLGQTRYAVTERIKDEVLFRKFNLMDSFPFKRKFHVIFCRNVMIYFDSATKNQLIQKFYDITEYGGFLFIGHAESLSRGESGYRHVMPSVYRKER